MADIRLDELKDSAFEEKGIKILIARLDLVHPVVSGNKLFKLHYFLDEAKRSVHKTIVTFGGAYSNHLVATAYAGSVAGLRTIGYVRGEEPVVWSHTLQHCRGYGMELHFISREIYDTHHDPSFTGRIKEMFGDNVLVPEGGYHPLGAKGASLIMEQLKDTGATHLCTAVGTATTLAGILAGAARHQQVVAVPVIKNMHDIPLRLQFLNGRHDYKNLVIDNAHHFGGYAKRTPALLGFMNDFYENFHVPLDFVYTGKMMAAVMERINNDHFSKGSIVVCLHTGGLQGNASLPEGSLVFS